MYTLFISGDEMRINDSLILNRNDNESRNFWNAIEDILPVRVIYQVRKWFAGWDINTTICYAG